MTDLELKQQAEIDSLTAELEQVNTFANDLLCAVYGWEGKDVKYIRRAADELRDKLQGSNK